MKNDSGLTRRGLLKWTLGAVAVVAAGCPSKPASKGEVKAAPTCTKEIYMVDAAACTGCGICEAQCAEKAISHAEGAVRVIDPKLCVLCGACASVCPERAIRKQPVC
jgi:pyruvate formate lyase activating enzyme